MFTRRDLLRTATASALLPAAPAILRAQEEKYPSRVIKAICMFPPGTGADILVRWYADKIAKISGGSVIVENRPGAFAQYRDGGCRAFQTGWLHNLYCTDILGAGRCTAYFQTTRL